MARQAGGGMRGKPCHFANSYTSVENLSMDEVRNLRGRRSPSVIVRRSVRRGGHTAVASFPSATDAITECRKLGDPHRSGRAATRSTSPQKGCLAGGRSLFG